MEAKSLNFATGIVEYNINDACTLSFNPTDANFAERLFDTFDKLDEKQEAYKAEIEKAQSREIFSITRRRDAEMREMLDSALGAPVCASVFGGMNVYAYADGLPVWANLLLAVIDEMDNSFAREQKLTNPRVNKYLAKYQKR